MNTVIKTVEEARRFLEANQPMVSGFSFDAGVYDRYSEVLQVLIRTPDAACSELFLASLTAESHEGVAQSFAQVLRVMEWATVIHQLGATLTSGSPGARAWAAEYAVEFPDLRLIEPLSGLLRDAVSSRDAVIFAVAALEMIRDELGAPEADLALRTLYHENATWQPVRDAVARSEAAKRTMAQSQAIIAAEAAFRNKDYHQVVNLLGPFEETLQDVPRKRLQLARKFLAR